MPSQQPDEDSDALKDQNDQSQESSSPEVFALPNGMMLLEKRFMPAEVFRGELDFEVVTYELVNLLPDSDWHQVGLRPGDTVSAIDNRSLHEFTQEEVIRLISQPETELSMTVHQSDGGWHTVDTSLADALEYGLPGPVLE